MCACVPGFEGKNCSIGKLSNNFDQPILLFKSQQKYFLGVVLNNKVRWTSENIICYLISLFFLFSDIDDCDPYPCLNNGACIDGVNNYTCACSPGFEGRNCTISEFCFSFMSVFMKEFLSVKFVVGSFICSERFFSGYSGFPLSSKTSIFKFQFDQESGKRRTTIWMCYLQIVIYLFIYLMFVFCFFCLFVCFFGGRFFHPWQHLIFLSNGRFFLWKVRVLLLFFSFRY